MRQLSHGHCFLLGLLLLFTVASTSAHGEGRWITLNYNDQTITYDLHTVQLIGPEEFTVVSTTVDRPDIMRFRLAVLKSLRSYCAMPDGNYEAPFRLLTLGLPDMPVYQIEVNGKESSAAGRQWKDVLWRLPYRRFAFNLSTGPEEDSGFFSCDGLSDLSPDEEYTDLQSQIIDGTSNKELYDCKRGAMGLFVNNDDPPSKAITTTRILGAYSVSYLSLCLHITGHPPYIGLDAAR